MTGRPEAAPERPTLIDALTAVAARTTALLVATDFDGVLAPFVIDPLDARPQPGTRESLLAIAALPGTTTAVVSGRDLQTLTTLTGLGGSAVALIGSHGAESSAADGLSLDQASVDRLLDLRRFLADEIAASGQAIRLEHKPAGVVLHTRGLPAEAEIAAEGISQAAGDRHGVRVLSGKGVREFSVVTADKGTALSGLATAVGAEATVYFGDDVTDEHVFEVLGPGDIGIKVGEGATAAGWRIADSDQVPEVLETIRRVRSSRPGQAASRPVGTPQGAAIDPPGRP